MYMSIPNNKHGFLSCTLFYCPYWFYTFVIELLKNCILRRNPDFQRSSSQFSQTYGAHRNIIIDRLNETLFVHNVPLCKAEIVFDNYYLVILTWIVNIQDGRDCLSVTVCVHICNYMVASITVCTILISAVPNRKSPDFCICDLNMAKYNKDWLSNDA